MQLIKRRPFTLLFFVLLITAISVLGACRPATITPGVETVEVPVPGPTTIVTATPVPATPSPTPFRFTAPNPGEFVYLLEEEPYSLDPAQVYGGTSAMIIQNIYETLLFYDREAPNEFVPQLATDWAVSDDGLTYVFSIRPGVHFHSGAELTALDAAYSLQRALLQGGSGSPQWLLAQALLGVDDVTLLVDPSGRYINDPEGLIGADPASLQSACEQVKTAIAADEAAGTLTFRLTQPFAPLPAVLAQTGAAIVEREWSIANGAWDGSCTSWENSYLSLPEDAPMLLSANGTGPFRLESWMPGEELRLVRNDDYWRSEAVWEGGPSGPAALAQVVFRPVADPIARLQAMRNGEADMVDVPDNIGGLGELTGERYRYQMESGTFTLESSSDDPQKPLRLYENQPGVARMDLFFNFAIANPEGSNSFIGSGQLDGNGIPVDFFTDVHVRRAFNYCFDRQRYMEEAFNGNAYRADGLLLPGMPGYAAGAVGYEYDLDKCAEEFQASDWTSADEQSLWDTGFRLQLVYRIGDENRRVMADTLASGLYTVNPKFRLEIIGLPWESFLINQRANTLPLFTLGWQEDLHDPHHWMELYLNGPFARSQNMPEALWTQFQDGIRAGLESRDPQARAAVYQALNQQMLQEAPNVLLPLATLRHYERRWVQGWYYNPMLPGPYFYALSKQ